MSEPIELPDYLPSRYKNWYDLYFQVIREFEKRGEPTPNNMEISLLDFGYDLEHNDSPVFKQTYTIGELKIRAFDFLIEHLPTRNTVRDLEIFYKSGMNTGHPVINYDRDEENEKALNNLFLIAKDDRGG